MSAYQAALAVADEGVRVFPCKADKKPACARGFLAATSNPFEHWWNNAPLVGMPTGAASGYDVLDLDLRKGADVWWEANKHRIPATRTQHTRNGGLHIYFKVQHGLRNSVELIAPGVDVRAEGGYVIRWDAAGLPLEDAPVADWPAWLLADLATPARTAAESPAAALARLAAPSVAAVAALLERLPNPVQATRDTYTRVMLGAVGALAGLAAAGIADNDGAIRVAAIEWAERWEGGTSADEAAKWDDDWATRTNPLAGWNTLEAVAAELIPGYRLTVAQADFASAVLPPESVDPDAWHIMLRASDKGVPYKNLANALVALRHAPAWSGVLALNTFASRVELHNPPPWHRGEWKRRALEDNDARHATEWMQLNHLHVGVETVHDAILAAADENAFHPVRRYLDGLTWDGTARLDGWLVDHLGAEDTDLNRAFASRFLIGAVARTMRPGCKLDTALMLEGDQNLGKSSALRALCPDPDWFTDHISELGSKDARQDLQGKLILEFAELDVVSRADVSKVKSFLSTAVDHFRGSYARVARDYPRCGVFAGTINPENAGYLKDNTGNRRFWTVACGIGWMPGRAVNLAALASERDQLWAEAVVRFKAGQPWWLDERALQVAQAGVAELRREVDVWEETILAFVRGKESVSTGEILSAAIFKPLHLQNRGDAMKVAGILRAAQWMRKQVRVGDKPVWRFHPPMSPGRTTADVVVLRPRDEIASMLG